MANITNCPEIANLGDSDIELSTYNTSVGTYVVIGCKGFGRHVSSPTNVECLATGDWSESPNLKCKVEFDEKEKIILAAAIVSAALILLVVFCLCCYCCCCRRRRYHHRRYWRGKRRSWDEHLKNGWGGWGSRKDINDSGKKGGWWSSRREITDHPSVGKDKKGGWWSRWSSRREFDDVDGDKDRRNGWFSGWTSKREFSDKQSDGKDRKRGWWTGWTGRRESFDKESDRNDRKGGWFSGWTGKREFSDKHSDRNDRKGGWFSGWTDKREFSDKHSDGIDRKGGWAGWTSKRELSDKHSDGGDRKGGWWTGGSNRKDSTDFVTDRGERKEGWWRKWKSRSLEDLGDGYSKRHYRSHEWDRSPEPRHREYHSYREDRNNHSNDSAHVVRDSRKYFEDRPETNETRIVQRYSDHSLPQYGHGHYEVMYESNPRQVEYNRTRRNSDPQIYRTGRDVIYDSAPMVTQHYTKPAIIVSDENQGDVIRKEPCNISYESTEHRHSGLGSKLLQYTGPAQVLDPIYYTEPQHYRRKIRYAAPTYTDYSTRLHYSGNHSLLDQGHVNGGYSRWHGNPRLPPLQVDEILKHVNRDLVYKNDRVSNNVSFLSEGRGARSVVPAGGARQSGAHYEVSTITPGKNPNRLYVPNEFTSEKSELASKVGDYVLYQGKNNHQSF